ncbi:MAG: VOC family protein [Candidatus Magasanikbacteria bacterium]|nr:VOC family protein [Candidatus Magasanikbacteria bacterium]
MKPKFNAVYLAVKDMDRAVKFYEEIFDTTVSSKDERMSSFDFENVSFLLFNPALDDEKVLMGNNVVPNIEVEDINKMLELIKSKNCEIVLPLDTIGEYLIFQAKDTEGNVIEFYQVKN